MNTMIVIVMMMMMITIHFILKGYHEIVTGANKLVALYLKL